MGSKGKVYELDVREDLKNKLEPFQKIMAVVKQVEAGDTFILHSTFKPKPLQTLLRTKGFTNDVEKIADDHFITTFIKKEEKKGLFSFFRKKKKDNTDWDNLKPPAKVPDPVKIKEVSAMEPYRLDNRGLEPPQPMMRTLSQLEKMNDGETLIIRNDRVPVFLIEELKQLGYGYSHMEMDDGSVEITIIKREG
ncbi:DUF2249 domain-containing protein [Anaerobacillus sp. MEB173]|uniref:DUF2249 domain-containing protein n=1 Tax=Anaerobacillus sp. MEB173 TaxID=3383345 RepID=UPI003F8DA9D7